jgi:hypothetical protein
VIEVTLTNNLSFIDIQIHFYFEDNRIHAMNAELFNNCQRQFINTLRKADKFIDESLLIEVTARKEGGLIDNIRIIFIHPIALDIIKGLVISFFSAKFRPKVPITEETKNKLENIVAIKEAIISGTITEDEFEYIASNDKELKKLKSNFFKTAKKEETLTQIEVDTTTIVNDLPAFNKITVPYDQFDDFILLNDEDKPIDSKEDDKARIFLIAPVLVKGVRANWKGYYGGIPIDFRVRDKEFLERIYSHDIQFGNGTYIDGKLITITTHQGETNREVITHEVVEVNELNDGQNFKKPIKHKKNKYDDTSQGVLFSDESRIE